MVLLVVFDFGATVCDSVGVIIENLIFVPSITVLASLVFRSVLPYRITKLKHIEYTPKKCLITQNPFNKENIDCGNTYRRYEMLSSTVRFLGDCVELLSLKLMNVPKLTV